MTEKNAVEKVFRVIDQGPCVVQRLQHVARIRVVAMLLRAVAQIPSMAAFAARKRKLFVVRRTHR